MPSASSTTTIHLLLSLVVLLLYPSASSAQTSIIVSSTIIVIPTTVTTYVSSPTGPASPQYTDDLSLRTSVLNSTNLFRYQHNASFLAWNESLAAYAQTYAAQCIWAHSHGPQGYGENLARGYPDVTSSVDAWGDERALYSFDSANVTGFTEATGHFTQLVWKATQSVGCAAYACDGQNNIGGYLLVCEYWPPGNIEGLGSQLNSFFIQNVQAQIHTGVDTFNTFSATVGATGVGTSWASGTLVPTTTLSSSGERGGQPGVHGVSWEVALPAALLVGQLGFAWCN